MTHDERTIAKIAGWGVVFGVVAFLVSATAVASAFGWTTALVLCGITAVAFAMAWRYG